MKPAARRQQEILTAPQVFSLVEAPDETIKFLSELRRLLPAFRIEIDLRQVKRIHPEAVAAFVAIMESAEGTVFGNVPTDPDCTRRLRDFGFFEHVKERRPSGTPAGTIRMKHTGQEVKGEIAQEIIEFGLARLSNFSSRKHGPTYTVFTEAMANTFQHAGQRPEDRQRWWAAVYYDDAKQAACFTSVDLGVGILENFKFRQRWKLWFGQTGLDQGRKLKMLLDGKVPSRTGESYRGRGLPNIKKSCTSFRIKNLLILSNKAHADVSRDAYQELTNDFHGTIIYWEVPNATPKEDNG